jgi:putative acetyltransferase
MIQIRTATEPDYDGLGQIMYAAVHEGADFYTREQRQAWMPKIPQGAEWHARLNGQYVVLAHDGDQLLGFMSLDGSEVDLAFILPTARGRGVFRTLYEAVERHAQPNHAELTVYASLHAQAPFAAMGFETIHHEEVLRSGEVLKRAYMKKKL